MGASCPESTFAENAENNIPLKSLSRTTSVPTVEHTYVPELFQPPAYPNDELQHKKQLQHPNILVTPGFPEATKYAKDK